MISNSRPNAQKIAFGASSAPSTKAADTYSDDLMDDLFLDVDQILDGDLSSYMTVVGHKPKPINPANRTVQLPANFAPRSAADIYRATVDASSQQPAYQPPAPQSARPLSSQPIANRSVGYSGGMGYGGGGRPVTTVRRTPRALRQLSKRGHSIA